MVGTFTRSFLRFFTSSLRVRHFVSADQCVRLYGAALAKFKLFDVQVKRFSHRVISLFCISDVLYISPQKWSTLRDFRTNVSITDIEREIKKKKHKEKIKWFYSFYSRPPVLSLALVIGQEAVFLFVVTSLSRMTVWIFSMVSSLLLYPFMITFCTISWQWQRVLIISKIAVIDLI